MDKRGNTIMISYACKSDEPRPCIHPSNKRYVVINDHLRRVWICAICGIELRAVAKGEA